MTEIVLKEAEVTRLNLQPGEVLMVKIKADDLDYAETVQDLQKSIQSAFPNNKVMVFAMGTTNDVSFEVAKGATNESAPTTA